MKDEDTLKAALANCPPGHRVMLVETRIGVLWSLPEETDPEVIREALAKDLRAAGLIYSDGEPMEISIVPQHSN